MSNTKKLPNNDAPITEQWNTFAAEADRPDFVLGMPEGQPPLHITNPTGTRAIRLGEALRKGDDAGMLLALTGDAYSDVWKLASKSGHKAVPAFVERLMDHFDMYEDVSMTHADSGDIKVVRTPSQVKALRTQGYRPTPGE